MSITIKMKCVSVTKKEGDGKGKFVYDAVFQVVTSGSQENDNFFKFTPYGGLNFGAIAEGYGGIAGDHFVPGQEYYVTLNLFEADKNNDEHTTGKVK